MTQGLEWSLLNCMDRMDAAETRLEQAQARVKRLEEAISRLIEIYDNEADTLNDVHDGIRACQAALAEGD